MKWGILQGKAEKEKFDIKLCLMKCVQVTRVRGFEESVIYVSLCFLSDKCILSHSISSLLSRRTSLSMHFLKKWPQSHPFLLSPVLLQILLSSALQIKQGVIYIGRHRVAKCLEDRRGRMHVYATGERLKREYGSMVHCKVNSACSSVHSRTYRCKHIHTLPLVFRFALIEPQVYNLTFNFLYFPLFRSLQPFSIFLLGTLYLFILCSFSSSDFHNMFSEN